MSMRRILFAAFFMALGASFGMAGASPRPLQPVEQLVGTWHVTYYGAEGPDPRPLPAAEYERYRRGGSCGSNSHVGIWPNDHEIQLVCEL
jgi:hypothetical protein